MKICATIKFCLGDNFIAGCQESLKFSQAIKNENFAQDDTQTVPQFLSIIS